MKRLALLALLPGCFLFKSTPNASCQEGRTVELSLPEDVKKFAGCSKATGLVIRTGATIDVTPLSDLEEVTGDIQIFDTGAPDIAGLKNLTVLGGSISISGNTQLEWIYGLDALVDLPGNVIITENAALTRISRSSFPRKVTLIFVPAGMLPLASIRPGTSLPVISSE